MRVSACKLIRVVCGSAGHSCRGPLTCACQNSDNQRRASRAENICFKGVGTSSSASEREHGELSVAAKLEIDGAMNMIWGLARLTARAWH